MLTVARRNRCVCVLYGLLGANNHILFKYNFRKYKQRHRAACIRQPATDHIASRTALHKLLAVFPGHQHFRPQLSHTSALPFLPFRSSFVSHVRLLSFSSHQHLLCYVELLTDDILKFCCCFKNGEIYICSQGHCGPCLSVDRAGLG